MVVMWSHIAGVAPHGSFRWSRQLVCIATIIYYCLRTAHIRNVGDLRLRPWNNYCKNLDSREIRILPLRSKPVLPFWGISIIF